MIPVIVLTACVCVALITIILTSPGIRIGRHRLLILYWYAPVLGAILLLCLGLLSPTEVWTGLTATGSINPLKILVLFLSMTSLSIFLDEAGMFRFLAGRAILFARSSQKKLFLVLYLLVSILTVFTSNDIIILTFTPFICYFAKNAGINPIPYLFGEFVAANTWSMALIIGNPTNIYLATSAGITFGAYVARMALPTVFAGVIAYLLLRLIFRRELNTPMSPISSEATIRYPWLVRVGVLHLGLCTVLLVLSSYLKLEMWLITLCFAVSLFLWIGLFPMLTHKKSEPHILRHTLHRLPWELIPFVISMFLLVLALENHGVSTLLEQWLTGPEGAASSAVILQYGASSFLVANVMNNIPMAVLFGSITGQITTVSKLPAVYAAIIGSNLGAFFTPLGALAGIMWAGILKRLGIDFSFRKYISYGVRISIPALFAALLGLWILFR